MAARYVPTRGDFVWLDFDPQAGHEQGGKRPALVVSPAYYNRRAGLALFCPVTSRIKGYPFEVSIAGAGGVAGAILADQVKSLDWRARRARRIESAAPGVVEDVLAKMRVLVEAGTE